MRFAEGATGPPYCSLSVFASVVSTTMSGLSRQGRATQVMPAPQRGAEGHAGKQRRCLARMEAPRQREAKADGIRLPPLIIDRSSATNVDLHETARR